MHGRLRRRGARAARRCLWALARSCCGALGAAGRSSAGALSPCRGCPLCAPCPLSLRRCFRHHSRGGRERGRPRGGGAQMLRRARCALPDAVRRRTVHDAVDRGPQVGPIGPERGQCALRRARARRCSRRAGRRGRREPCASPASEGGRRGRPERPVCAVPDPTAEPSRSGRSEAFVLPPAPAVVARR